MTNIDPEEIKEWIEKYKPILDKNGDPYSFADYGAELEFVQSHPENLIWTHQCHSEVDENGIQTDVYQASSGFYKSNRIGFFVCEVPSERGDFVNLEEVIYDEEEDEADEEEDEKEEAEEE